MALVERYPLEYYHYPSHFPRVNTRYLWRGPFTRDYTPPPTTEVVRREVRSRSLERALPVVRYRASSLPPVRSSSPIEETSSLVHDYVPTTFDSYIDKQILSRPSTVSYIPRAVRDIDYRLSSLYRDYRSDYYDLPSITKTRYFLEPRFTHHTHSTIVPTYRYGHYTVSLPNYNRYSYPYGRYYYEAYPRRYPYTSSRTYNYTAEPRIQRSQHTHYRLSDGSPMYYSTYKMLYPSTYTYRYRY